MTMTSPRSAFFFGTPWGAEVPDPPWKRWGRWPQTLAVLRHGWRCLAPRCLAMRVGHDSCHEKLRVSEKHDSIFRVVTVDQGRRHWNSTHVEAGFFFGCWDRFSALRISGMATMLNRSEPGSSRLSCSILWMFTATLQPLDQWDADLDSRIAKGVTSDDPVLDSAWYTRPGKPTFT